MYLCIGVFIVVFATHCVMTNSFIYDVRIVTLELFLEIVRIAVLDISSYNHIISFYVKLLSYFKFCVLNPLLLDHLILE